MAVKCNCKSAFRAEISAGEMNAEAEAIQIFSAFAGIPADRARVGKEDISRAAVAAGMDFGRVKRIWKEHAHLWANEMDELRRRFAKHQAARREANNVYFRQMDAAIAERMAVIESRLAEIASRVKGEDTGADR